MDMPTNFQLKRLKLKLDIVEKLTDSPKIVEVLAKVHLCRKVVLLVNALAIFGDIWRYLAIFGDIWRYLAIFGDIWRYLAIFGDIWRYLAIFGDISAIFGDIWRYLAILVRY